MLITKMMATILVILWLLYFSEAVFTLIKALFYWLIYKPVTQLVKLFFG